MSDGNVCCICDTDITSPERLTTLQCGHPFHGACLDEYREEAISCPHCGVISVQYSHLLNERQTELVQQALKSTERPNFHGLCFKLPMGTGKTRTMIVTALNQYQQVLWITSKTLIPNLVQEIRKLRMIDPTLRLNYEILHRDHLHSRYDDWRPKADTQIIITTPQTVARSYNANRIEQQFVHTHKRVTYYRVPRKPLAQNASDNTGPEMLHARHWPAVIIDESQNYTNSATVTCRAIASLAARHKWCLSATPLQEPKIARVLGFFMLLNQQQPDNLPDCKNWIKSGQFPGFDSYAISCEPPAIKTRLERTRLQYLPSPLEQRCFHLLHDITKDWHEYYQQEKPKFPGNHPHLRKIRGHLVALLTYMRLALVLPQQALSRMIAKIQETPELHGLRDQIADIIEIAQAIPEITHSSRLGQLCRVLKEYEEHRTLVFGSFHTTLQIAKEEMQAVFPDRPVMLLDSSLSLTQRQRLLDNFCRSPNAVLFMSYQIGSEGLNLQQATNVVHLDPYWNDGKQQQALARAYRTGQDAATVYQHFIVSNIGFEQDLLRQQLQKLGILQQLDQPNGQAVEMKVDSTSYLKMTTLRAR